MKSLKDHYINHRSHGAQDPLRKTGGYWTRKAALVIA